MTADTGTQDSAFLYFEGDLLCFFYFFFLSRNFRSMQKTLLHCARSTFDLFSAAPRVQRLLTAEAQGSNPPFSPQLHVIPPHFHPIFSVISVS